MERIIKLVIFFAFVFGLGFGCISIFGETSGLSIVNESGNIAYAVLYGTAAICTVLMYCSKEDE